MTGPWASGDSLTPSTLNRKVPSWFSSVVSGNLGIYTPRNYGAVLDGVTDDTVAVLATIAACPPGAVVQFSDGTALVTSDITVDKAITIVGGGPRSVLIQSASTVRNGLTITGHGARVLNLRVLGNGVAGAVAARQNGIYIADAEDVVVEGCVVEDGSFAGIQMAGAVKRCRILNNTIKSTNSGYVQSQGADIYASAGDMEDIWVEGNECLSDHKNLGIAFQPSATTHQRLFIRGNTIKTSIQTGATLGHGIMLYCSDANSYIRDAEVSGNAVRDCEGIGIYIKGGTNKYLQTGVVVLGNRLYNVNRLGTGGVLEDAGISVTGALGTYVGGNSISGNTVLVTGSSAIRSATSADETLIIGNSISDWSSVGIMLFGGERISVLGNVVDGATGFGIRVRDGANHQIAFNTLRGSANDAIQLDTTAGGGTRVAHNFTAQTAQARGINIDSGVSSILVEHNYFSEGAVRVVHPTLNTFWRNSLSTLMNPQSAFADGTALNPGAAFQSEVSLGLYRSAASIQKQSYGWFSADFISSSTTAQSGATARIANQGQLYFSVLSLTSNGGEFGFRSGNTVYRFASVAVG